MLYPAFLLESWNTSQEFCLFCSLLYPQPLRKCLHRVTTLINSCWLSEFSLGKPQLSTLSDSMGSCAWSCEVPWMLDFPFLLPSAYFSYSSVWPDTVSFIDGRTQPWFVPALLMFHICYALIAPKVQQINSWATSTKENFLCISLGVVLCISLFSWQISGGPYTRHNARPRKEQK